MNLNLNLHICNGLRLVNRMVQAVRVTGLQSLRKQLNNVRKLPKKINDVNFQMAKLIQRNLRVQLTRNKTIWRNKLWNSIQAKRKSKNISVVTMAKEGIYLDSMQPHYVKLKRGRLIRKWALEKGKPGVQKIAAREGSIFVKPHPFIDVALSKSLSKLSPNLRRTVKQTIGG